MLVATSSPDMLLLLLVTIAVVVVVLWGNGREERQLLHHIRRVRLVRLRRLCGPSHLGTMRACIEVLTRLTSHEKF